jgi:hypothetical protein
MMQAIDEEHRTPLSVRDRLEQRGSLLVLDAQALKVRAPLGRAQPASLAQNGCFCRPQRREPAEGEELDIRRARELDVVRRGGGCGVLLAIR